MTDLDRTSEKRLPQQPRHVTPQAGLPSADLRSPALRPADFIKSRMRATEPQAHKAAPVPPQAEPQQRVAREEVVVPEEIVIREQTVVAAPTAAVVATPSQPVRAPTPLLDLRSGAQAIWKYRFLVLALGIAGAVGGALLLPRLPLKYTASTSLYFDPRQIGLAEPGTQGSTPPPDMISATIDSKVQILTSGAVLRRVIQSMKLDQDPEFNGGRTDGGAVMPSLQKALTIARQGFTYVVSLTAITKDPQKSARLANEVVAAFLAEEAAASGGLYENTTATLDSRLNELRQRVQEAEQAVENYRAENDMAATSQGLISDQRLASLNSLLVSAQERTIQAKAKADAAASLNFDTVIAGNAASQDSTLTTNALANLRQQYATQAAIVSSLQSQMGARHPRLLAARSSMDSVGAQIREELQRLVNSAKADYDQAKKAEEAVGKELAVQKSLQATTSDQQVELNELQRKAAAARSLYETVLKRSGQTSEERNLVSSNVRVVSEAEPPIKANGPGKTSLLLAGIIGGFFGGFGLGATFAILMAIATHPTVRGYMRPR